MRLDPMAIVPGDIFQVGTGYYRAQAKPYFTTFGEYGVYAHSYHYDKGVFLETAKWVALDSGLFNGIFTPSERVFVGFDKECTCGTPSKANYYVMIIASKEGETDYFDAYKCEDHKGKPSDIRPIGWKILSHSTKRIR